MGLKRDDLVELLSDHYYDSDNYLYPTCNCGDSNGKDVYMPTHWAAHVADVITAKDWCVVVRGSVANN